jgi:hypothetical protein
MSTPIMTYSYSKNIQKVVIDPAGSDARVGRSSESNGTGQVVCDEFTGTLQPGAAFPRSDRKYAAVMTQRGRYKPIIDRFRVPNNKDYFDKKEKGMPTQDGREETESNEGGETASKRRRR